MAFPKFVQVPPQPLERFRALLGAERYAEIELAAERARQVLSGRAIWHVSSTARGGGVAEILHSLLPYVRGAGIDTRWVVLREAEEFFAVTKRIHNRLHGDPGDGGELGEDQRRAYEGALAASGSRLIRLLQKGDVIYLHDPQTAGLVPMMKEAGLRVIWRCHIGVDDPNDLVRGCWAFLRRYIELADAYVFSRAEYVWDGLDRGKVWLMAPAIDPFSPKNQALEPATVGAILETLGLLPASSESSPPLFVRGDGTPGRVERRAEIVQEAPLPDGAKLVAQVSRWDRLKDPRGLLQCFERHLDHPAVHLVMAGPSATAVADDPEGAAVYGDVAESWRRMPAEMRRRAHLVSLPMFDLDENGAMVNALQRRADVIVQKSLAEGFGLTVTEGMWKEKPVVGARVGGIQDQIVDGESGLLIDPHDLEGFGRAIRSLVDDPERAATLGRAARLRVTERFLGIGRLMEYVGLVSSLVAR
jgi:trehalose synthase